MAGDDGRRVARSSGRARRAGVNARSASFALRRSSSPVVVLPPPASIIDYASFGSIQKAGNVPVSGDGDLVTRWVGDRAGLVLTATDIVAQLAGGSLCAKNNASGFFSFPGGFATSRTDFSLFLVLQRPECFQTRAHFGFGASRLFDSLNFGNIQNLISNGVANRFISSTGRASTFVYSVRSNAAGLKVGVNGVELDAAAFTAEALVGGKLLSFFDGTLPSSDRLWGWAIGPYVGDDDFQATVDWCKSVRVPPSEVDPNFNIVVFGDSQTSGLNAGGHSWMLDVADAFDARIIPIVGSATYFNAGGSPQSRADNLTQLDLEYRPGATRNILFVGTSNDLDQGVGAGAAYAAAIGTKLGSRLGLWEVFVARQPVRTAPWNGGNGLVSFNTERAAFNAAIATGGWTGLVDWSGLSSGGDGVHWPSDQQTVARDLFVSGVGLV